MPKKAILCVDDEKNVLQSLRRQLVRNFGKLYQYEIAECAEEALEVIEDLVENDIEVLLIVSDWLMPNIKGDVFLLEVHKKFPDIVKIMLTGQADEVAIERVKKDANLYDCIYKPWSEISLIQTIKSALEK
jgi:DNA-binding NtrC family response regulator